MSVAVIGGMERLERHYMNELRQCGVCTLRDCFNCLKRKAMEVVINSSKLRKHFFPALMITSFIIR